MPQRSYDFSGLPDQSDFEGPINQYDFSGLPDQEEPRKYDPNSWFDWTVNQGIRIIPTIAGGMMAGPLGGGAGAVLGSAAGNWWEGRPFNPYETAVEGALGMLPGFGEAPGAGAGLRQIGKYALQSAGTGAVQGLVGSVPRHIASTGNWELPSAQEALGETIGGAGFGAIMGAGHGLWNVHGPASSSTEPPSPKYIHDMSHGNYEQSSFDLPGLNYPEHDPRQQFFPEMSPDDMKALREAPTSPKSPYGFGMGQPSQRMLDFNAPESFDSSGTSFDSSGQGSLFADPRAPQVRTQPVKIDPQVVDQMRNPRTPPPPAAAVPPKGGSSNEMDDILKAIDDIINKKPVPEDSTPAEDVVKFPTSVVTDEFKKNMTDGGYEIVGREGRDTIFRKTDEITRGILDARGPFNSDDLFKGSSGQGLSPKDVPFEEQWRVAVRDAKKVGLDSTKYDNLDQLQWDITRKAAIITMDTGINPLNDPRMSSEMRGPDDNIIPDPNARKLPPNVETGRVAPFERGFEAEKDQGIYNQPTDPTKLQDFLTNEIKPQLEPSPEYRVPKNLDEAAALLHHWDQVYDQAKARGDAKTAEDALKITQALNKFVEHFQPPTPEYTAEQARQADLMRQLENPTYRKPRPTYPTDRPIPLKQGQMELPFSKGEADHPIDADARAREIQAIADRLKVSPGEIARQLSMEGQMKDAEIQDYLKKEDGIPPESYDIRMPSEARGRRVGSNTAYDESKDPARMIPGAGKTVPQSAYTKAMADYVAMEKAQNEAYRAGDTKKAVEIGQNMEELDARINRYSNEDIRTLGPRNEGDAPGPAFRSRGNREPFRTEGPSKESGDELIGMQVGNREDMLRNMQGQYSEHGARVANKELLQNAIDALTNPDGTGRVDGKVTAKVDYPNTARNNNQGSITIEDNGPGMSYEMVKKEYITLTGSGKRGQGRYIGEMGVGKATYLLGADRFDITTTHRETDGRVWQYRIEGTPEDMINQTTKLSKKVMPDNTPTGTVAKVYESNEANLNAARYYLQDFKEYSNSPVAVDIHENSYNSPTTHQYRPGTPRTSKVVGEGSGPGGNFKISIPDNATWNDGQGSMVAVLTNRGMFQGAERVSPPGMGRLPDHIIVDIDPTVPASNGREYPLTAPTRERMKAPFKQAVTEVVDEKIMKAARKNQQDNIQAAYDALTPQTNPVDPSKSLPFVTNNRGGRYTQQELDNFNSSPVVQKIGTIMGRMLNALDQIFPNEQKGGKTARYGFDLANPNAGGINIPNPSNDSENAILINLMGALHQAKGDPIVAAERITHTILHEFNHNIVRNEGGDFTWSFINVDSKFGTKRRGQIGEVISKIISGPDGKYAPEVQKLLQEHTTARGRQDSQIDYLARPAESGIVTAAGPEGIPVRSQSNGEGASRNIALAASGPTTKQPSDWEKIKSGTGWGQGASATGRHNKADVNFVKEALALPSSVTTGLDASFPGRQGLTQILTKEFWQAAGSMFKGLSPQAYKAMNDEIKSRPLFHDYIGPDGKLVKSLGTQAGIKIHDIASNAPISKRAEGVASRWLEQGIGTGPIATGYKNTIGALFRATNRMSVTFLNQLGANRFENLVNAAEAISLKALETGKAPIPGMFGGMNIPGIGRVGFNKNYNLKEAMDINPHTNLVLAKEIADFVNTAIGHGPLKTHILPFKQTEVSLEGAADKLRMALFSPGLIASRLRMTNPSTYIMASPFVRKQYMKAALSTASAWFMFTEMAKLAGGEDVSVSNDITNADFGKVRIGDTRMDAGGGFLQFLTAYGRLYKGGSTSSSTGTFHKFGEGYQAQTQEDMFERFMVNKLNPVAKFAYDLGNASQYNPFHVGDRVMQMFVPLVLQDMKEIVQENPHLIPWMVPVAFGMGTQSYSKGESVGKLINPENDWLVEGGGGVRSLMPWNYGENQ